LPQRSGPMAKTPAAKSPSRS